MVGVPSRSPLVRVLEFTLLAATPVVLLVGAAAAWAHANTLAFDFDRAYAPAAHLVLHGSSPYGPTTHAVLSSQTAFVWRCGRRTTWPKAPARRRSPRR